MFLKYSKTYNGFLGDLKAFTFLKINLKLTAVIKCQHYNDSKTICYMKLIYDMKMIYESAALNLENVTSSSKHCLKVLFRAYNFITKRITRSENVV